MEVMDSSERAPPPLSLVDRFDKAFSGFLLALSIAAALLLLAMLLLICLDVGLRNFQLAGLPHGLAAASDLSEAAMYLMTLLASPWLLRQGQHIRVDILLRAIPKPAAWRLEFVADALALACCLVLAWYGLMSTLQSREIGAMTMKALIYPEWWLLAPLPLTFMLLAVEVGFRIRRLTRAPVGPRDDVVSAS